MLRALLLAVAAASASAFSVVTPVTAAVRPVVAAKAAPLMVLEPTSLDAASQLLAMSIPIPAYTPAKAFVMIAANVLVISTMRIQGKSLISGTSHDEMVESFGITWLLAGTALGHVVGAGAILGIQASGAI